MKLILLIFILKLVDLSTAQSDVVGKITVGFQGWFAARGDGSPIDAFWHWSRDWSRPPSINNHALESWPDMREYTEYFATDFPNLGNGSPARVFSSFSDQTLDVQFKWMREHDIDTVALQRFNPFGAEGPIRDAITSKVRTASEKHGRKFYIMYDVSDWLDMQSQIKDDWTNKMSAYISSTAYARQNGMPVVCIWGFGFDDGQRPFTPEQALDVIDWFKAQNLYVIGGVPTHWRSGNEDSRPGFYDVYAAFHMISPWMVGRITSLPDVDHYYGNVQTPDHDLLVQLGIDYQPCVIPGNNSAHHRQHGDFMWRQFYNLKRIGVEAIYISMFDEYNEANQIAKTAEDESQIPVGSGFVTLDEDGVRCSSDYYLRLTKDGGRMFKGETLLTAERPTVPWINNQGKSVANPLLHLIIFCILIFV